MNCESLPLEDTAPGNSFAWAYRKLRKGRLSASDLPQGQTATPDGGGE